MVRLIILPLLLAALAFGCGKGGGGTSASSWYAYIEEGGGGFYKIQPWNISLWLNGLVNPEPSCVQVTGNDPNHPAMKRNGQACATADWGFTAGGATIMVQYLVDVFPSLPFNLIGLSAPMDFPHEWKQYCWDARQAWERTGGQGFVSVAPQACGTLPQNNQPRGGAIIGLYGQGVSWASLSDGKNEVRRQWQGFRPAVSLYVNELNDNTIEPGWWLDDENLLAGGSKPVPAGRYQASETITVR